MRGAGSRLPDRRLQGPCPRLHPQAGRPGHGRRRRAPRPAGPLHPQLRPEHVPPPRAHRPEPRCGGGHEPVLGGLLAAGHRRPGPGPGPGRRPADQHRHAQRHHGAGPAALRDAGWRERLRGGGHDHPHRHPGAELRADPDGPVPGARPRGPRASHGHLRARPGHGRAGADGEGRLPLLGAGHGPERQLRRVPGRAAALPPPAALPGRRRQLMRRWALLLLLLFQQAVVVIAESKKGGNSRVAVMKMFSEVGRPLVVVVGKEEAAANAAVHL
mmetsp:Transcript_7415/g.12037  ORF Transcript_7415/g.12037 Transcript_7415/m.12037 type:complete len:272 (+) Transcript_7415:829-1644(+)